MNGRKAAEYCGLRIVQEKTLEPRLGCEGAVVNYQDKSKRVTGSGNRFAGN